MAILVWGAVSDERGTPVGLSTGPPGGEGGQRGTPAHPYTGSLILLLDCRSGSLLNAKGLRALLVTHRDKSRERNVSEQKWNLC